ncbi:uncharacterized protein LOC6653752 [Drosophila willistoni]|uniref:uncharacterized protein LOC6653752 n=1 Tax=Drosophila willistoni TaxID=7260 RepID=UPI001F0720A2|nr:uncharacterized protein LOC6653752 [Drosophila willistoni]
MHSLMDMDNATLGLLRSPFSIDIPHAFVYNDTQNTRPIFCGPYMETVKLFAQVYHYELQLDELESLPKKSLVEQKISDGNYNLSLHGVLVRSEMEERLPNETEHSYPLELMRNCVMVPFAPELPKWMYVVWPLGRYIWTSLFLGIFYIAFLMRWIHWREKSLATKSITQNMLYAMAFLMYSPNMNMNLKLSRPSVRVLISILI